MLRRIMVVAVMAMPVLLSGCNGGEPAPCDEFAPPTSRVPTSCPKKPVTEQPYKPARYCYRTIGMVDCYDQPQPNRPGYMGSYSG